MVLVDDGGWTQRLAAPTARMAALLDSVNLSSAATLPTAGLLASSRLTPEIILENNWHNLPHVVTALRERKVNGKAMLHVD